MILFIASYLAGVITILSPCILPVLPFVFAKSGGSSARGRMPVLLGMIATFAIFSALVVVGGEWVVGANEWGRSIALIVMGLFGLSLIFPHVSEKILAPLTNLGGRLNGQTKPGVAEETFTGSLLIGMGTGLLWAPCAGPILGLVLTGAASRNSFAVSLILLLAYAAGAASSLGVALYAGQKVFLRLKQGLKYDRILKTALGVTVLLGVAVIALHLDRSILTQVSRVGTEQIEGRILSVLGWHEETPAKSNSMMMSGASPSSSSATISADEPSLLPSLSLADSWLNTKPISADDLKGKVVLIDFWTYSCINCLRTIPYVREWAEKYKDDGLVVIGVHSPEFAFEKSESNVKAAVEDINIKYPVAIDSHYKIWTAFQNQYWPAHYFIDRNGKLRHQHSGEGNYEQSELILRQLLAEGGHKVGLSEAVVDAKGVQKGASELDSLSPETYVGQKRAENYGGTPALQVIADGKFKSPRSLKPNGWALDGNWAVESERSITRATGAKLKFRFHARDLHLVMGAAAQNGVPFRVTIDGHSPGKNHGLDVDDQGNGLVRSQRLYQLIRFEAESSENHNFEIEFSQPRVEVYAFTFG